MGVPKSKPVFCEFATDKIRIPERHRKDMGDLDGLARSIERIGLLHPIGITQLGKLVYGERRLRAVRDVLGWAAIPALTINIDALEAEHDENQIRKDFTISERVAIAKAIEERIGNRQGKRTDQAGPGLPDKYPEVEKDQGKPKLQQNFAEVEPAAGEQTRGAAARVAGFGNHETYRQARTVVANGTATLAEAMDAGRISISAAAEVAEMPAAKQEEVVKAIKEGVKPRKAISEVKEGASEPEPVKGESPPPTDALGIPLDGAAAAFEDLAKFDAIEKLLRQASQLIHELGESPGGIYYRSQLTHKCAADDKLRHYSSHLKNAQNELKWARPYASRCPYCHHEGEVSRGCRACHGIGWVTKQSFEMAPRDYQQAVKSLAVGGTEPSTDKEGGE